MTELTSSLAVEKVNIRWTEPYVSAGLNRQAAGMPPGLYKGGDVDYSTTTNLRIWGGSFVLRDATNGFGLLIRDPDQTIIDCASLFPATGETVWYVGIRVDYSSGNPTTSEYFFTDVAPSAGELVGEDGLAYYKVTIHDADTGLDEATFEDMLVTSRPTPYPHRKLEGDILITDRHIGLVSSIQAYGIPTPDEKDGLAGHPTAPSSANKVLTEGFIDATVKGIALAKAATTVTGDKVQLTGWFYVGKGAVGTANKFFRVAADATPETSLVTVTEKAAVTVSAIYNEADSAELNPGTYSDADGYYQNPWVYLTTSGTTLGAGVDFSVVCVEKTDMRNQPSTPGTYAFMTMDKALHAELVTARYTGLSNPVWKWYVQAGNPTIQDELDALFVAANEAVLNTTVTDGVLQEIWRTNGSEILQALPNTTQSKYASQGGTFWTSGSIRRAGASMYSDLGGNMSIISLTPNTFGLGFAQGVAAGSSLGSPVTLLDGNWDETVMIDGTGGDLDIDFSRGYVRMNVGSNFILTMGSTSDIIFEDFGEMYMEGYTKIRKRFSSKAHGDIVVLGLEATPIGGWTVSSVGDGSLQKSMHMVNCRWYPYTDTMSRNTNSPPFSSMAVYQEVDTNDDGAWFDIAVRRADLDDGWEYATSDYMSKILRVKAYGYSTGVTDGPVNAVFFGAPEVTLANGAYRKIADIGEAGLLMVSVNEGSGFTQFGLFTKTNPTVLIQGTSGVTWGTSAGAAQVNVYRHSDATFRLENQNGASITCRVAVLGMMNEAGNVS